MKYAWQANSAVVTKVLKSCHDQVPVRMPQLKCVESLSDLCKKRIPAMVKAHIVTLTEHLVNEWWDKKIKQMEKEQTFKFENRSKVLLVSGRVKEMEEEVVTGDGDIDFEFKEDLDQYDLTHIELDTAVSKKVKQAVIDYR